MNSVKCRVCEDRQVGTLATTLALGNSHTGSGGWRCPPPSAAFSECQSLTRVRNPVSSVLPGQLEKRGRGTMQTTASRKQIGIASRRKGPLGGMRSRARSVGTIPSPFHPSLPWFRQRPVTDASVLHSLRNIFNQLWVVVKRGPPRMASGFPSATRAGVRLDEHPVGLAVELATSCGTDPTTVCRYKSQTRPQRKRPGRVGGAPLIFSLGADSLKGYLSV